MDIVVAIVAIGNVDSQGRADQNLIPYDGHHVALYVGESQADFDRAFLNADQAGIV